MSEEKENKKINSKHSRFGDALWYGDPQDIIIGGSGGTGSWTSLFLARIGHNLYLFDFDTYDETNAAGQYMKIKDIGKNKAEALRENIIAFTDNKNIECHSKYEENSIVTPIMISCFDNMKARKLMFENWKAQEDRELFIDSRMSAEDGMVFIVTKGKEELYESTLFTDEEAQELPCSFKATSHCGALIGSIITSGLNNYLANKKLGDEIRELPFKTEFQLSMMNFEFPEVKIPEKVEENV